MNLLSFQEIGEYLNLTYNEVYNLYKPLKNVFEAYSKRGDNNSLIFESSALAIFERAKYLKEQGFKLEEIGKKIKEEMNINAEKEEPSLEKPNEYKYALEKIESMYNKVFEKQEEIIKLQINQQNLEKTNYILQSQLLLLTDGKTPEEVKKEKEEQIFLEQQKKEKKQKLLFELEQLQGKFFQKKRKLEIINELKEL